MGGVVDTVDYLQQLIHQQEDYLSKLEMSVALCNWLSAGNTRAFLAEIKRLRDGSTRDAAPVYESCHSCRKQFEHSELYTWVFSGETRRRCVSCEYNLSTPGGAS